MASRDTTGLGTDKLYDVINANIRATDEISVKLLGLASLVARTRSTDAGARDVRAAIAVLASTT